MNIATLLQQHARQRPVQAAIVDGPVHEQRVMTFAQLENDVGRFAALLKQRGLKRGDHALIFQTMSAELYVILIALFRLGMIAMFIDPSQGRAHIERCCQRVPPKLLVASSKAHLLRLVSRQLRRIPVKMALGWWVPGAMNYRKLYEQDTCDDIVDCSDDTPALMTFTSGSTGLPKAAVRSHGFLLAQHRALAANLEHVAGEVDMVTLPIFVLANLASALTSEIADVDLRHPGKIDAAVVVRQLQRHDRVRSAASPAFYERLIAYCQRQSIRLNNVTRIDTGGAPVFPGLLAQLQSIVPQAEIVAVYGSTEAEPIAHIHWQDVSPADLELMLQGRGLLAGRPVAEIDCKVIHDQFGTTIGPFEQTSFDWQCCAINEVGEIVVAGDHVLPGYLDGQGDEETKFRLDGRPWHRTGDAGYFDEQGRLWLLGRCMARIKDDKGELYPFAVETVARSDIHIQHAAMVSWQGKRVLVIQIMPGRELDIDSLHTKLDWAALDEIKIMQRIPVDKRHNAKIDYPALYQQLER